MDIEKAFDRVNYEITIRTAPLLWNKKTSLRLV